VPPGERGGLTAGWSLIGPSARNFRSAGDTLRRCIRQRSGPGFWQDWQV